MGVLSLISIHRPVGVDPYDQPVPQLLGPLQILQMADMKNVEAAAGGYHPLPLPAYAKIIKSRQRQYHGAIPPFANL